MIDPLSNVPHSWNRRDHDANEASYKNGALLFRKVSDFYFWCMARDTITPENREVFSSLSVIMQICRHSSIHGNYIEDMTEHKAAERISDLKESLRLGTAKAADILPTVRQVLETLTECSGKARLVETLTLLEMKYITGKGAAFAADEKSAFYRLFDRIASKIHPERPDFHAEAVSRDLKRFISEDVHPQGLISEISISIEKWLSE